MPKRSQRISSEFLVIFIEKFSIKIFDTIAMAPDHWAALWVFSLNFSTYKLHLKFAEYCCNEESLENNHRISTEYSDDLCLLWFLCMFVAREQLEAGGAKVADCFVGRCLVMDCLVATVESEITEMRTPHWPKPLIVLLLSGYCTPITHRSNSVNIAQNSSPHRLNF